jgi:hypothetical protein
MIGNKPQHRIYRFKGHVAVGLLLLEDDGYLLLEDTDGRIKL